MSVLATAVIAAAPLVAADAPARVSDEKNLFHIPSPGDFRLQRISRTGNEKEWPFTVDEGYLTCAFVVGRPAVYFTEVPAVEESTDLRTVIVSTDPFDLAFGNLGDGGLVSKNQSIADLIRLMAPFESLGSRLCDQPRGAEIGSGEL